MELQTEILPHLALSNAPVRNPGTRIYMYIHDCITQLSVYTCMCNVQSIILYTCVVDCEVLTVRVCVDCCTASVFVLVYVDCCTASQFESVWTVALPLYLCWSGKLDYPHTQV